MCGIQEMNRLVASWLTTLGGDATNAQFKESKMSEQLTKLIDAARGKAMSSAEKEAQRRSFAYGNAHIENDRVTRDMVAKAAEKIGKIS